MLLTPTRLKKGDLTAIAAPASPAPPDAVERAVRSVRFLGLEPLVLPGCLSSYGYLSGSDLQRASDLNAAFADPNVKGIFCLRGGYGSARLFPLLDLHTIRKNPKVFVGYSDITALHLIFNQLCGFSTLHGPMPCEDYTALDDSTADSLTQQLFSVPRYIKNPFCETLEVLYPGRASGILTGGNLSLLAASLGSPYEINTQNRILFIEEVGEAPYRIDRALAALALAGKFRSCAGIILGTFSKCEETKQNHSLTLDQIFRDIILPWKKPTLYNLRAGHCFPQCTLPLGAMTFFDTRFPELRQNFGVDSMISI